MKKSIKALLLTVVLTIAVVTPVLANETNLDAEKRLITNYHAKFDKEINTIAQVDNNGGQKEKAAVHTIIDAAHTTVVNNTKYEEKSYINYLNNVVRNYIETERVMKERVDTLTNNVKACPALQPQLDAAIADYNKTVADHQAAIAAIGVAQGQFDVINANFELCRELKGANDPDLMK